MVEGPLPLPHDSVCLHNKHCEHFHLLGSTHSHNLKWGKHICSVTKKHCRGLWCNSTLQSPSSPPPSLSDMLLPPQRRRPTTNCSALTSANCSATDSWLLSSFSSGSVCTWHGHFLRLLLKLILISKLTCGLLKLTSPSEPKPQVTKPASSPQLLSSSTEPKTPADSFCELTLLPMFLKRTLHFRPFTAILHFAHLKGT